MARIDWSNVDRSLPDKTMRWHWAQVAAALNAEIGPEIIA